MPFISVFQQMLVLIAGMEHFKQGTIFALGADSVVLGGQKKWIKRGIRDVMEE